MPVEPHLHIFLHDTPTVEGYTSPSSRGPEKRITNRDRISHSAYLTEKFNNAWQEAERERVVTHSERDGVYIEFKSDPGADLVTKSLDDLRSKKVRLLNVRTVEEDDQAVTYATVYVANEKRRHFLDKIEAYATQDTQYGKAKNYDLINSIADLRKALLIESFWLDNHQLIPSTEKEWCEVWLSSDSEEVLSRFEELLRSEQIESARGFVRFPERIVKVILANREDLSCLTSLSDDIAEYRRAKDTTAFWVQLNNQEQAEWIEDLLRRVQVDPNPNTAVCILDTGVNNGHPLLEPVLLDEHCLTVDPTWGVNDHQGHGTMMAGITAYGDLKDALSGNGIIQLQHCLESVKILPPNTGQNHQELWGHITAQGVSRAEIEAPEKKRILCLGISATDTRDRGRPSSWSGKIDQLSSGAEDTIRRLFVVASGNVDLNTAINFPAAQITDSVHDPGQSWNALTVGAYTELEELQDRTLTGYLPVARSGQLSPFSTTSVTWEDKWPIKPEIVMEGGNLAYDGIGFFDESDDLCLLTTHKDPTSRLLCGFNMTSSATAQASWLSGRIQKLYPQAWPETVRALVIHSADWTDALKAQFLQDESKTSYSKLLRICGYGVPNLQQAMYSATNSLTLIAQNEIQPFDKQGGRCISKDMHLYDLPWPTEVLTQLPDDVSVQMKVTLSYFIEPGPGEIGWKDRYRYASHALRFDVKSPNEERAEFLRRINVAARSEEEGHPRTPSAADHWTFGANGRDKGSIHSDIWTGTAAELAASNVIAVYPVIGWWRERAYLGLWGKQTRYSLIVSITTESEDIDIYTPIANRLGITIQTPVTV